jgi:hypothetical protein
MEIVQYNTEKQKSALSHLGPEVEIEHSSTQATLCSRHLTESRRRI